jgi:hypothetical protein
MSEIVTDECLNIYKNYDDFQREVVAGVDKTTFTNEQIDKIKQSPFSLDRYQLIAICTNVNTQKAAHDQWNTDINILWDNIKNIPTPIQGGSQKGGADCPADFQKIFNYMFLIAASASIAVMSPDINLVANVCMKALTLVFGTIALPILNLLRVVFLFMLQSLVLIVKTLGTFAVQIISNFIKTVYLNINTIASGAIGIAKVFIYRSLTYCGSFYNMVVAAMPKEIDAVEDTQEENEKIADTTGLPNPPTIPLTITTLNATEVGKINESLKAAIKGDIIDPEVNIIITVERDIFMDMLTNFGEIYDAIRKQIKFGYTFLKTAYFLLCENAHHIIKDKLGVALFSDKAKLSLTKGLIYAENSVILAVNKVARFPYNVQAVIIYNINVLCLKILKIVYSKKVVSEEQGTSGKIKPNRESTLKIRDSSAPYISVNGRKGVLNGVLNGVSNTLQKINETNLEFNLNFENPINTGTKPVNDAITTIKNTVGELKNNPEYASIMEDLEEKLQEIIDMNTTDALNITTTVFGMNKGGAKKRRTKKAKKHIKKRRYSRKH